jgi:hypothetical protein
MLPSYAHTEEDVDLTLRRLRLALSVVAAATRDGDFNARIEIPLL